MIKPISKRNKRIYIKMYKNGIIIFILNSGIILKFQRPLKTMITFFL